MKIKTSIKLIGILCTPMFFASCTGSSPVVDDETIPTQPITTDAPPIASNSSSVKSAELILKDLGMEGISMPSEDRIIELEKSLNSQLSLKLLNGTISPSDDNTKQIEEIKKACRVKESGSFLLVVKSEDEALLASITETFSKDPTIECVGAGTTETADQVDLILKLY